MFLSFFPFHFTVNILPPGTSGRNVALDVGMSVFGILVFIAMIVGVMYFSRKYNAEMNPRLTPTSDVSQSSSVTQEETSDLKIVSSGLTQNTESQ